MATYPWNAQNPPPSFTANEFVPAEVLIEIVEAIEAIHEGASEQTPETVLSATKTSPLKWTVATGVTWSMAFDIADDGSRLPFIWWKQGDVDIITEPDAITEILPPDAR